MSDDDAPHSSEQLQRQQLPNPSEAFFCFDTSSAVTRLGNLVAQAESMCRHRPEDKKKFINLTCTHRDVPGMEDAVRMLLRSIHQPFRNLECIKNLDLGKFPLRVSFSSSELFSKLYSLETIKFPKEVIGPIGGEFLSHCDNLKHIEFTEESFSGVMQIGDMFCGSCKNLVSVDLSGFRNVATIGNLFLARNPKLEKVASLSELRSLCRIGAHFLAYNGVMKNLVFDGRGASGHNVTYIGDGFLLSSHALTSVEFSDAFTNVEYLEHDFLSHCFALERITFKNSFSRVKKTFSETAFGGYFCAQARSLREVSVLPGSFSHCTDLGGDMFIDSGSVSEGVVYVDLRGFEKLDATSLCVRRDSVTSPPPLLLGNCSVGASGGDGEVAAATAAVTSSSSTDTSPPRRLPVVLLPDALRVVVDENIFKQSRPSFNLQEYSLVNRLEPLQRAAKWSLRKHLLLIRSQPGSNSKMKEAMQIWNVMTTIGLFL